MYDYTYYSNVIVHSGTKGMKWGQRRYQNPDGSLTPAGRERYGVGKKKPSLAEKVKKAASNFTKDAKKTGKEVKKAVDKRKAKKLKEEQDKAKADRESWFKDKKSMYEHFGEMTTEERDRALRSMEQFDKMEKYKANSTSRNLELIKKGLEAAGVKGFDDLMKGATTLYNLTNTIKKDQKNKKKEKEEEKQEAKEDRKAEKDAKREARETKKREEEARKRAIQEQDEAEQDLIARNTNARRVMEVMFSPKKGGPVDDRSLSDFKAYYEKAGIDKNKINKAIAEGRNLSESNVTLAEMLIDMKKTLK